MGQSSEELKLRLTSLTKILKIGLVTIIILVLVVIGGLSAILVNTSAKDKDFVPNARTQTLILNGSNECNCLIDGKLNKSRTMSSIVERRNLATRPMKLTGGKRTRWGTQCVLLG